MYLSDDNPQIQAELSLWRQHLHRHPETAFEETATANFIADKLRGFGLEVHEGVGKTGVVATLSAGDGQKKIALRADMDALFIQEQNEFDYKSRHEGKMHACGHDGHTAMLLGAAQYLAKQPNFNGTVQFIFQPAEEGRAGAKAMLEDGLFERFPADYVFGMHNWPALPAGHFAIKSGAMMAAFDCFEITLKGQATHAAMPHLGSDVVVAAAQLVTVLQTIVSRSLDPAEPAVVSITQIHAGHTWNAVPESVVLRGTFRCFSEAVQKMIAGQISQLVQGVCACFRMTADITFNPENPGYPVTFNSLNETAMAVKAALAVVGEACVELNPVPSMGSEDFAFMLQEKPGCYIWIGNGPTEGGCLLHNPHYDFNDSILTVGVAYWIALVETILSR
ncbi:MAG: M20 aminoacylase family protein [Methylococcaceae bacterium]|jgi:hippurate hydrolase